MLTLLSANRIPSIEVKREKDLPWTCTMVA